MVELMLITRPEVKKKVLSLDVLDNLNIDL